MVGDGQDTVNPGSKDVRSAGLVSTARLDHLSLIVPFTPLLLPCFSAECATRQLIQFEART